MTKNLFAIFIILLLSFFAWRPLLSPGFFSMHDDQQIARLFELNKALLGGQFPVRWVPDLGFGLGYAVFNFYPPLVYYLGEIFHLAGASFIDSTKLVWFAALFGSGVAMYYLAREFFGKIGGVVAATFYLYGPYHGVDAYVRGALAELFSFVWLPLILLTAARKQTFLTGILLALLMITHNLIFLPFFGFFALWTIFFHRWSAVRFIFVTTLIAFGLTAFFWMPELWEKKFTLVDDLLIKNLASYQIHFVCPWQLWDSPWGYGGSAAGCIDGFSLKIGKPHLLVSAAVLIATIWLYWYKRVSKKLGQLLLVIFSLLVITVFMSTDYSKFVWDLVSPLWYLQFPWRFLEFATLFSALLAGGAISLVSKPHRQLGFAAILLITVLAVSTKYFQPQQYFPTVTDQDLTSDAAIKWHVSSTSFEYLPTGIATTLTDRGAVWIDITESEALKSRPQFPLKTNFSQPTSVQFGVANFPGWKVWVDDQPVQISDANKFKLITVSVPTGQHQVTGSFTNTPVRSLGNAVSILTLFLVILGSLYGRRRNKE